MNGVRLLPVMALIFMVGCEREAQVEEAAANPQDASITRTSEEGPVKVTVSLSPENPLLGDPLKLSLTVEAQAEVTVDMPAFGEALGRFSILDFTPRQQTRADGSTVASQIYTLQAPMSGRQRIPPLRIEYLDLRGGQASADDEYRELLSEELAVEIQSVLPEGEVTDELRGPREPLAEIQAGFWARYWPWLTAGLIAVLGAAGLVGWWQRRATERARITAYDRALKRLTKLEAGGLPSGDEADSWYVELSDIVRRYLEDQYGLRAPELTSEEFLQEARNSDALTAGQRELLPLFLEQCDRVKYAAYSPQQTESQDALALARRFFGERPTASHALPEAA